jgi:hypothetical protein
VVVEKFEIKVIDPLASPEPVRREAEVSEGPLCRLFSIDSTANHSVSSKQLQAMFPIKTGEVFKKAKTAEGLETMKRSLGSMAMEIPFEKNSSLLPADFIESRRASGDSRTAVIRRYRFTSP